MAAWTDTVSLQLQLKTLPRLVTFSMISPLMEAKHVHHFYLLQYQGPGFGLFKAHWSPRDDLDQALKDPCTSHDWCVGDSEVVHKGSGGWLRASRSGQEDSASAVFTNMFRCLWSFFVMIKWSSESGVSLSVAVLAVVKRFISIRSSFEWFHFLCVASIIEQL